MPPLERSAFDGKDIEPIFLGTSVKDCSLAEGVLDVAEVEYAVEIESIETGPFSSDGSGAVFYVPAGQAQYCRRRLHDAGLSLGVIQP
jgi:hypothetical protein